jgi:hypothetical protein
MSDATIPPSTSRMKKTGITFHIWYAVVLVFVPPAVVQKAATVGYNTDPTITRMSAPISDLRLAIRVSVLTNSKRTQSITLYKTIDSNKIKLHKTTQTYNIIKKVKTTKQKRTSLSLSRK